MSNTPYKDFAELYREIRSIREDFGISESHYRPPRFFKCERTNQVFMTLGSAIMGCPVHLNHNLTLCEGEVHYAVQTREWVLGAIRCPETTYEALRGSFALSWVEVKIEPVAEEHTNEFGPVSP